MAKFLSYDYIQSSMVVINFNDQIQTGTFEYAVHHLVDNKRGNPYINRRADKHRVIRRMC